MYPSEQYLKALQESMVQGQYSDLLLTCCGEEFRVHKIVVCSHSDFFRVACDGNYKESRECKIDLPDDDLPSLRRMLSYMYTFDYDDHDSNEQKADEENSSCDNAEAQIENVVDMADDAGPQTEDSISMTDDAELFSSVRTYAIAEKYGIAALKDLARGRFANWINENWESNQFPPMVEEVFASTPAEDMGLRDVAVKIAIENISKLNQNHSWQRVVSQNGQLGGMLLAKLTTMHLEDREKLSTRIVELESDIMDLNIEKRMIEDQFKAAIARVNKHRNCRHCGTSLNVFFETLDNSTPRCRDCRTRHY